MTSTWKPLGPHARSRHCGFMNSIPNDWMEMTEVMNRTDGGHVRRIAPMIVMVTAWYQTMDTLATHICVDLALRLTRKA